MKCYLYRGMFLPYEEREVSVKNCDGDILRGTACLKCHACNAAIEELKKCCEKPMLNIHNNIDNSESGYKLYACEKCLKMVKLSVGKCRALLVVEHSPMQPIIYVYSENELVKEMVKTFDEEEQNKCKTILTE